MPKDFNQSTSLESYLKLQWVYTNSSKLGYLKDSNAAAHSVDTGIS